MLTKRTDQKTKIVAVLIAAVCFFAVFFSFSCISACRNHSCTGRDCPVCAVITQAEHAVRQISSDTISGAGILLTAVFSMAILMSAALWAADTSLISQKIRMNN
ncbi:MAG: hypothetical protein LIP11_15050 [Clostridiales bacterium]|nr:hypothetical protein [Clostridiales bacterium]